VESCDDIITPPAPRDNETALTETTASKETPGKEKNIIFFAAAQTNGKVYSIEAHTLSNSLPTCYVYTEINGVYLLQIQNYYRKNNFSTDFLMICEDFLFVISVLFWILSII
jgi:hypothetical protein